MYAYVEEKEAPSVRLTRAMFPRETPFVMSQKLTSVGVLWREKTCKREANRVRTSKLRIKLPEVLLAWRRKGCIARAARR